jgi:putative GTP pyrophosphokinase
MWGAVSTMRDRQRNLKSADELSIRTEFEARRAEFDALATGVRLICDSILRKHGVPFHSIKVRVKSLPSLLDKIIRKKYSPGLGQLTDLVGVRIICLYTAHVDRIVDLVKKEFNIREVVDKRPSQDERQFGYSSVHLVCDFCETARSLLPEYSQIEAVVFEVQVRTILQEAWSEIEHELIYKSQATAPKDIRRQIVRLSGSLEIADEQFQQIYDKREQYLAKLRDSAPSGLEHEQLNIDSLLEVIRRRYQWASGWESEGSHQVGATLSDLIRDMRKLGVNTVRQLIHLIDKWYAIEMKESLEGYLIASGAKPRTTVDDEMYAGFEFQSKRDRTWFHKTKHYFTPPAQIRGILYLEFPDYKKQMDDGTWHA